ncbi:PQQ-dependent sugar dehydrogenase [Maribacter algicola]|uniref:PQQ-dependent sugar dehydrogenase n=1 Tax=Meishania litoralis TaxID=3434685 RepID=A0ACC7LKU6_9FLAO
MLLGFATSCNFSDTKENKESVTQKNNLYVGSELAVQHGMELFNQHCASCHNFRENEIGPNLSGVTSEVPKDWLKTFIKDPKSVIENGDPRASALFEKYKLYMPPFSNFNDEELEDLLGFVRKFSEAEKKNKSTRKDGILDPIVDKIPTGDLSLVLEEWLTLPPSSQASPLARINTMRGIKTRTGERLFLADLRGKLYEITNGNIKVYLDLNLEEDNFMDNPGFGTGLGSFAFHPDFETNGRFYTTHTEPPKTATADFAVPDSIRTTLQWVLTEWQVDDTAAIKFNGLKREVLRADMVTGVHGFQELTFNTTAEKGTDDYGLLYLGIGDGGTALSGYPELCDNPRKIWGSVLRIDPTGNNSKNGKYGIPKDNPFVDQPDKLGEIWCRGFRNPHRISWNHDRPDQMFISNIGQHSVEEVNLGEKGADFGWPDREGTFLFDPNANTELVYPLPKDDAGYSYPIIQYDHDEGNAVSGGFVYTNTTIPLLKGKYIFGDIPRGTLFYAETGNMIEGAQATVSKLGVTMNGQMSDMEAITQNQRVDLRFGLDGSGNLYIFTKSNGKVYKVVDCISTSL